MRNKQLYAMFPNGSRQVISSFPFNMNDVFASIPGDKPVFLYLREPVDSSNDEITLDDIISLGYYYQGKFVSRAFFVAYAETN